MGRIHPTWARLAPGKDEDHREDKRQYISRIRSNFTNLPEDVLEQWIYPHHFNEEMRRLYGWLDYEKVAFSLVKWTSEQVQAVKVYSHFRPYVESTTRKVRMAGPSELSSIDLRKEVIASWINRGTWRTPIIVLESSSFVSPPRGIEINRPYQLVEGHTRLGWFIAFLSLQGQRGTYPLAETHSVWLMTAG
jgi:hypothetical protein